MYANDKLDLNGIEGCLWVFDIKNAPLHVQFSSARQKEQKTFREKFIQFFLSAH